MCILRKPVQSDHWNQRRTEDAGGKKGHGTLISAVTSRVANMRSSVRFYRDVLGVGLVYGGEDAGFSSLCLKAIEVHKARSLRTQAYRALLRRWGKFTFCGSYGAPLRAFRFRHNLDRPPHIRYSTSS
jgi:catechol 2,3-dioxygenase-like lactoylglutathione lyase family enzyme